MSTVLTTTPFRDVHDIDVKTTKGRVFVVYICHLMTNEYDSTVTVLDRVSKQQGSWMYETKPATKSAEDNFKAALELIQEYLVVQDSSDSITDIHNPCNCPFVSEADQNSIASILNLSIKVSVN